jgi:hypothetical protein
MFNVVSLKVLDYGKTKYCATTAFNEALCKEHDQKSLLSLMITGFLI